MPDLFFVYWKWYGTVKDNYKFPPRSHSNMLFPSSIHTLNNGVIGIEILKHIVHFLHRSSGLIEVDSLWSQRACESKTCTKTRLMDDCITHGWCHADVIHICQSETYPETTFIPINSCGDTSKDRKVNEYDHLQDCVCFYNCFPVLVHVH